MRPIVPGHQYELLALDGGSPQRMVFVQRVGLRYPGNKMAHGGTTMQEVLRMLIDRAKYVNHQIPCPETERAIASMRDAIYHMEVRAKRVKGKKLGRVRTDIENEPTCKRCGHIQCEEQHG